MVCFLFNLQSFEVLKYIVLRERYSKELEINFKYSQYGIHLFTILLIDPHLFYQFLMNSRNLHALPHTQFKHSPPPSVLIQLNLQLLSCQSSMTKLIQIKQFNTIFSCFLDCIFQQGYQLNLPVKCHTSNSIIKSNTIRSNLTIHSIHNNSSSSSSHNTNTKNNNSNLMVSS